MKNVLVIVLLFGVFINKVSSQIIPNSNIYDSVYFKQLSQTHDLNLPDWGPYTKRYAGISYLPDIQAGLRFDIGIATGYYRRKVKVANVMWESDFHPRYSTPDFSFYTYRFEGDIKDSVYTDVSFCKVDKSNYLIHTELVNHTGTTQDMVFHLLLSMQFPSLRPYSLTPIQLITCNLPPNAVWIDDIDYTKLNFAVPGTADNLVYDGMKRGLAREDNTMKGSVIGAQNRNSPWVTRQWGLVKDDYVEFSIEVSQKINNPVIAIRYRLSANKSNKIRFSGCIEKNVQFIGNGNWQLKFIALTKTNEKTLKFNSLGGDTLDIDGFAILNVCDTSLISFSPVVWNYTPTIEYQPTNNSVILKYQNSDLYYGLSWDFEFSQVREFLDDQLDIMMQKTAHNHTALKFSGNEKGHYTNVFMRPISVFPQTRKKINTLVTIGTKAEVESKLKDFTNKKTDWNVFFEKILLQQSNSVFNSGGLDYLAGTKLMSAILLTNVVYPVYTQSSYIKHYTPGRIWDCLYTWDSGFIGLGLAYLDFHRSIECLNAYTMPVGSQSAFTNHGSPVPVQIHLFHELWNKTQSKAFLAYFYPRMKQYYDFFLGRYGYSTTFTLKSNIIRTFDYFYNSGGWDDYPAQVFVHNNKISKTTTPVINTTQQILCAKILKQAAFQLGIQQDVKQYDSDIQMLSSALNKYAWNEVSGYFSYVKHDNEGNPVGKLTYDSGADYNMGLDGAYPILTGLCTENQKRTILSNLKTEGKLWSKIGLSAVDQSAPYFSKDGYWNGSVWFPHQWFFYKGMFDLGEGEFAYKIAKTALDLWKNETKETNYCFEHFMIESGRGAGWHQFGGLSSPIIMWFHNLFQPGCITIGYSVFITEKQFNENFTALKIHLNNDNLSGNKTQIMVCMNDSKNYKAFVNNINVEYKKLANGLLLIEIPIGKNIIVDIKSY